MKGEYPWVIPVDIICGGGNQSLREVVAAWIKRENQVGKRPKNYLPQLNVTHVLVRYYSTPCNVSFIKCSLLKIS